MFQTMDRKTVRNVTGIICHDGPTGNYTPSLQDSVLIFRPQNSKPYLFPVEEKALINPKYRSGADKTKFASRW